MFHAKGVSNTVRKCGDKTNKKTIENENPYSCPPRRKRVE